MGETAVAQLPGGILMIRSALILSAGLLAAACFACVAVAPPPPPPPLSAMSTGTAQISSSAAPARPLDVLPNCADGGNPNSFINKVYTLSYLYDPSNTTYTPPVGVQPIAGTSALVQYKNDLVSAYCTAAQSFKAQLDDLDGVFITCLNENNCVPSNQDVFKTSWGFRENVSNQSTLQHTYVALSADLWPPGLTQSPMVYSYFEYGIINTLLNVASNPLPANQYLTITPNPNTSVMTVLAALAHELGHIYWWKFAGAPNFNCGAEFSGASWQNVDPSIWQFHRFGMTSPGDTIKGARPGIGRIINDINHNGNVIKDLHDIYGGDWASLFATVSPDEDFVETYKLWMLASSGLTNFTVNVGPYNPVDTVAALKMATAKLNSKLNFIGGCYKWPFPQSLFPFSQSLRAR
jgi:hypothetical protein